MHMHDAWRGDDIQSGRIDFYIMQLVYIEAASILVKINKEKAAAWVKAGAARLQEFGIFGDIA